jgi:hypothetical protein
LKHAALPKKLAKVAAQLFFEGDLCAIGKKIRFQELDEFEVVVDSSYLGSEPAWSDSRNSNASSIPKASKPTLKISACILRHRVSAQGGGRRKDSSLSRRLQLGNTPASRRGTPEA